MDEVNLILDLNLNLSSDTAVLSPGLNVVSYPGDDIFR